MDKQLYVCAFLKIDENHAVCYTVISDRVAETCEACDRGNPCGDSSIFLLKFATKFSCIFLRVVVYYSTRRDTVWDKMKSSSNA